MGISCSIVPAALSGFSRSTRVAAVAACVYVGLFLTACSAPQASLRTQPPPPAPLSMRPAAPQSPAVAAPSPAPSPGSSSPATLLRPAPWDNLPGWLDDDLTEAWPAWRASCAALGEKPVWKRVCSEAKHIDASQKSAVQEYFHRYFQPYEVVNPDETAEGVVTGYYEPVLRGDLVRSERARYPIYGKPSDLVAVDLSSIHPELKHMRLRGRVVNNKLVPYFTRAEITDSKSGFSGVPIAWAEDPVELFYLQIQGSGHLELPGGERIRIGYADQNGYPFRSVARLLLDRGELTAGEATLEGIKRWGRNNPGKLTALLNENPSYIFFQRLPDSLSGPLGSLGVPLTERRSIAVDPRFIPLGAPVFLSTVWPRSEQPLNRLMLAQDTGGAIRGAVRVDFFWGLGDDAGSYASRMKQQGRKWVLLPADYFPEPPVRFH